jgi:hypothetical protein
MNATANAAATQGDIHPDKGHSFVNRQLIPREGEQAAGTNTPADNGDRPQRRALNSGVWM